MADYHIRLTDGNGITIPLESFFERIEIQSFHGDQAGRSTLYPIDADQWIEHEVSDIPDVGRIENVGAVPSERVHASFGERCRCMECGGPMRPLWRGSIHIPPGTGPFSYPLTDPETGELLCTLHVVRLSSGRQMWMTPNKDHKDPLALAVVPPGTLAPKEGDRESDPPSGSVISPIMGRPASPPPSVRTNTAEPAPPPEAAPKPEGPGAAEPAGTPRGGSQAAASVASQSADRLGGLVTLDQCAALVNRSKRSLERYKRGMPRPRVFGGGGKPHEYAWSEMRPWLEKTFGRPLPDAHPDKSRAG